jgi:hypothetical protein
VLTSNKFMIRKSPKKPGSAARGLDRSLARPTH